MLSLFLKFLMWPLVLLPPKVGVLFLWQHHCCIWSKINQQHSLFVKIMENNLIEETNHMKFCLVNYLSIFSNGGCSTAIALKFTIYSLMCTKPHNMFSIGNQPCVPIQFAFWSFGATREYL